MGAVDIRFASRGLIWCVLPSCEGLCCGHDSILTLKRHERKRESATSTKTRCDTSDTTVLQRKHALKAWTTTEREYKPLPTARARQWHTSPASSPRSSPRRSEPNAARAGGTLSSRGGRCRDGGQSWAGRRSPARRQRGGGRLAGYIVCIADARRSAGVYAHVVLRRRERGLRRRRGRGKTRPAVPRA
ncbi:hypothetical protein BU26DRAFT_301772 [Trematosphaeria pertusa]|uniref:Uncharacterized protein n=1 Tax=Trematosphaeria pertusa TaxID=390896 RepID=A0A6A6IJ63_9PLEO|nr:uncharacterized protein BU26DRAFT_301772 [Trematosphaeria pertusa]KAF2250451.1 hypothetical protein BU26DRAFT_301772 [Trematosphaeria pertusa]